MKDLKSIGKIAFFSLIVYLLALLPAFGAEPSQAPLLEVLGPKELTIPAEKSELSIPVRLAPGMMVPDLQTIQVTIEGETRDLNSFTFGFTAGAIPSLGILTARINRQLAAEAGNYAVQVLVIPKVPASPVTGSNPASLPAPPPQTQAAPAQGQAQPQAEPQSQTKSAPAPAQVQPQQQAKTQPQTQTETLAFTFKKPAAELKLAPLRIMRQVWAPWGPELYPSTLVLSENGGKSALNPYHPDWVADLTLPDGQSLPGRLKLSGLGEIKPWGQKEGQLSWQGCLGLGTAKGTISIRAPELASRKADFPVEIVSRAWLGWLVLILVLSIFLGYLARTVLEKRRKRAEALIAAQEQYGQLKQLIGKTVDDGLRGQLSEVLKGLTDAIQHQADNPETLNAAATKARQDTEAILATAKEARAHLAQEIDKWQITLESAGDQAPEVAQAVKETLEWLTGLEKNLKDGHIEAVKTALLQMANRAAEIGGKGGEWLDSEVKEALDQALSWPEINSAGELIKNLQESVTALKPISSETGTPETLESFLKGAARLWWNLHSLLYNRRGKAINGFVESILSDLEIILKDVSAISLDNLREAQRRYQEALQAPNAGNLAALLGAEGNLWNSLSAILNHAYHEKKPGEELSGLQEGNFRQACEVIKKLHLPPEKTDIGLGETEEEPRRPEEKPAPLSLVEEPPPAVIPVWRASIQGPGYALVGEPVTVELVIISLPGQSPPDPVVRWSVVGDPRCGLSGGRGELIWQFIPSQQGRLVVRAAAEVPATGDKQVAELTIEVMPAPGFAAAAELKKRLQSSERLQTLIYGLLITAVGFSIFRTSFVGTYEDIMAAALWGFTIDIGVAKIREFAAPLLTK